MSWPHAVPPGPNIEFLRFNRLIDGQPAGEYKFKVYDSAGTEARNEEMHHYFDFDPEYYGLTTAGKDTKKIKIWALKPQYDKEAVEREGNIRVQIEPGNYTIQELVKELEKKIWWGLWALLVRNGAGMDWSYYPDYKKL